MLVESHVALDVAIVNPTDRRLEIRLSVQLATHVPAAKPVCSAACLTEIALGVRHPRPRIDRVPKFLLAQLSASDVDGLEPVQLLAVGAAAPVDHELVIEHLLL